jgi:tetratricopeptide (TPR) repeat protein
MSTSRKLTAEAIELYRRAIQLSNDEEQKAWCFFNVARALAWLRAPETEIQSAYAKAVALLPQEHRFREWHTKWKTGKEKIVIDHQ